jgi:Ca-activated chloride channel homolog
MQFAQPLWLLLGLATCAVLFWRYRKFQTRQRASLARFAAVRLLDRLTLSVSPARRKAKQVLFILGVACLFVALARPQAGYEWQETHRRGLELLFAVDTSKSMLAQDVKPDRLSRAKLAVHDLVDKLNGDGVGLVAFAGNAFLQCPVTLDYDAFRESLDALDTKVIPRGGTDIAAAIQEGETILKTRTVAEKILVLITDGEDLGGQGIAAAKEAAKNGVKIFAVGVGNTTGELVPLPNENGGTDFARDASGQLVKSHLDEATLKQIAEATGGMYQPLGQQGEGLSVIYDQGLRSFTRHDLSARQAKVYLEQFQWALLAALACFIAEMLIGTRRKVRETKTAGIPAREKPAWARRPATVAAVALGLALLGATNTTRAALSQTAEQAYQKGDFSKSQEEYTAAAAKEPAKTELQFNAGSAAYKAGDLARAAVAFQNSLHTEEVPLQQGAYYNLGNTQFRLGQKTEKSNPKETIETWEQAVRSYAAALQIEPGDAHAQHNRAVVKRKIEQLKKQEEEKQQQQQQQDQKNNSKDQKSDPKNQQAGQNGQEPKDQQQQDQKNGAKDQKSDPKNQQAGQNGQEPKEQKQQEQAQNSRPNPAKSQPLNPTGKKPSQGQPEAANGQRPQPGDSAPAGAERREPGQMTKEEAQQLLDALKNDERQLPAISMHGRAAGQPDDQQPPLKDW